MLSNWKNYHIPGAPLREFLRHEPYPSDETKATFVTGMRKPRKWDRKLAIEALEARWKKRGKG